MRTAPTPPLAHRPAHYWGEPCDTPRTYPRTLAEAFPDERPPVIEHHHRPARTPRWIGTACRVALALLALVAVLARLLSTGGTV